MGRRHAAGAEHDLHRGVAGVSAQHARRELAVGLRPHDLAVERHLVRRRRVGREAGDANDILSAALGRLFAVAEAYPELRASENFLRLQDELTDTEDKISAARRYYNSTVLHYNTGIQSLPWALVARPLGFHEREFFSAEGDTATPQVSFTPAT